jgi:hypothetical protein
MPLDVALDLERLRLQYGFPAEDDHIEDLDRMTLNENLTELTALIRLTAEQGRPFPTGEANRFVPSVHNRQVRLTPMIAEQLPISALGSLWRVAEAGADDKLLHWLRSLPGGLGRRP